MPVFKRTIEAYQFLPPEKVPDLVVYHSKAQDTGEWMGVIPVDDGFIRTIRHGDWVYLDQDNKVKVISTAELQNKWTQVYHPHSPVEDETWYPPSQDTPFDGAWLAYIHQPQPCGNTLDYQRVVEVSNNQWLLDPDEELVLWRRLPRVPETSRPKRPL